MKRGYLSEYFEGVGVKTLSRVDATPHSNQHEVGTTRAMRQFLGEQRCEFDGTFVWIGHEQDSFSDFGSLTLYDAREKQPGRSPEWRLYYKANAVTEAMTEGDTLFLAKRTDGTLLFVVAPPESTIQNQLLWLFGFDSQPSLGFEAHRVSGDEDSELDFAARLILDEIGVEFEDPQANTIDSIVDRFGTTFPPTREFSGLARLTLQGVDPRDDPDAALIAWLNHEEAMFRRLERRVVSERLSSGFVSEGQVDVDGFLKFSLGVQNRRKSRMGHSLEHHLEAIFRAFDLRFDRQAKTEHGNTADFLFPGFAQYHDTEGFPTDKLTMLASKSSLKDRWRQVLPEARRIWPKHLATLEPSISVTQTDQMKAEGIQLVIPLSIQETFKRDQRVWLMSLRDFTALTLGRQT